MPATTPRWIVDTANESKTGLLTVVDGNLTPTASAFIRNDVLPRQIQLITNSASQSGQPIDITGCSLSVRIGSPDSGPTSGTWGFSYSAVATTGIAADISAQDLETLMNANAGIASAGGVKVGKGISGYSVSFDIEGARSTLVVSTTGLVPLVASNVYKARTGTIFACEVQGIEFQRIAYAEYSGWTQNTPVAGALTTLVAGSTTAFATFAVAVSTDAIGGSFSLTFGKNQIYDIKVVANTAIKAAGNIGCGAGSTCMFTDQYFDLPGNSTVIRFWSNIGGVGTPPAAPVGGSLSAITTITGLETALEMAAKIAAAVLAHAEFDAVAVGSVVTWTAANYGPKTTNAQGGNSNLSMSGGIAGNNGRLDQTAFLMEDEVGSVGCWFDASGAGATGYPPAAAAADRQIRFVVAAGDTAGTVAGVVQTAVNADAKFTSTNTAGTNLIRVTVDAIGERGEPVALSPVIDGFTIETNQVGSIVRADIPFNATAGTVDILCGGAFVVIQLANNSWRLASRSLGVFTAPTLNESGLIIPNYFEGSITFNEAALMIALAREDGDLPAILEITFTDALANDSTVLRLPVIFLRDMATSLPFVPAGYNPGDIFFADSSSTVAALPIGANGRILQVVTGFPQWTTGATLTWSAFQITTGVLAGLIRDGLMNGAPDSNYSFATDTYLNGQGGMRSSSPLTAARVYTMPAVSAYPNGTYYYYFDEAGTVSAVNTVTFLRSGADTINGLTSITTGIQGCMVVFRSAGSGKWNAWVIAPPQMPTANMAIAANISTASTTYSNTGLSFVIGANEVWSVEWHLFVTGATGGMKLQVSGPAAPTDVRINITGNTTSVGSFSAESQASFSAGGGATFMGIAFTSKNMVIAGITNGANAGAVQLMYNSAGGVNTITILRGSYMVARRIS